MKKWVLFAIFAVLFSANVNAQLFNVDLFPESQKIKQNETATYTLTVSHQYPNFETFEVYSSDILWDIRTTEPLQVYPDDKFTTSLQIRPLNVNPGIYLIPLNFKRVGASEAVRKDLRMEVTSEFPPTMTYLPAIRGTVSMQERIDPRDTVDIIIKLENQNRRDLKGLSIKVRSSLINKDYTADLSSLQKKKLTFTAQIDPYTPPQKDLLKVTVIASEKDQAYQFDLAPIAYEIMSYGKLEEKEDVRHEFLKVVRLITLTNAGNKEVIQKYGKKVSLIDRLFSSSEPKAEKEGGYLLWDTNLTQGASTIIYLNTNYRPLAIIILLIIAGIISYFLLRSPLVLIKSVSVLKTKEGGISELKVILNIHNRSNTKARNVRIIDMVPRIAELAKEYDAGTLKPDKVVQHEHKGTLLKWVIEEIDAKEQVIITYRMHSKLSILGGITLPVAVAKTETARGRTKTTNSNAPAI